MIVNHKLRHHGPWWLLLALLLLALPADGARSNELYLPGGASVLTTPAPLPRAPTRAPAVSPPPTAADLAETPGVVLTPAIRALAAELEYQPLAIYRRVREQTEYIPAAGLLRGAAATLSSGEGGAADTASLLIALLRASDIPARFVSGSIRVPAPALRDWLGVDSTGEALHLLTRGGIVHQPEQAGGEVAAVVLDHVWVEAWLDMAPGRGSGRGEGDAWVALDASAKALTRLPGSLDRELGRASGDSLAAALAASTAHDTLVGWREALSADALDQALRTLLGDLAENPATTLADSLGDWEIIPEPRPVLPLGLPFPPVERRAVDPTLAVGQRHRVVLDLEIPGQAPNTLELELADVLDAPLWLRFVPEELATAIEIADLLAAGEPLPGYRLTVRPELWQGEQRLLALAPLALGEALALRVRHLLGSRVNLDRRLALHAGEHRLLAWQAGSLDGAGLQTLINTLNTSPVSPEHLFQGAAAVFDLALRTYADWQSGVAGGRTFPDVQVLALGPYLQVSASHGPVQAVQPAALGLELVQRQLHAVAPASRDQRFLWQLGQPASRLAADTLALLQPGPGLSAPALLARGLAGDGGRVYWLDETTAETVLAALDEQPELATVLRRALDAGWRGSLSAPVTVDAWRGRGVMLYEPLSGASAAWVQGVDSAPASALAPGDAALWLLAGLDPSVADPASLAASGGRVAAALEDLLPLLEAPQQRPLGEPTRRLLAGSLLDLHAAPTLAPLLADGLWQGLLGDDVGLAALRDPLPPVLEFTVSATAVAVGESVTIDASATDDRGAVRLSVTVADEELTGSGPWQWTPGRAGEVSIVAEAVDAAGNRTRETALLSVSAPLDSEPPQLALEALPDPLTAPLPIGVTVADANLRDWELLLIPRGGGDPSVLASGDAPVSGEVATLDPTLLRNGLYALQLSARDANDLDSVETAVVAVEGDLKLGEFSFSVVDLVVPMVGLPIQVGRAYDSRRRDQALAFGHGWSELAQAVSVAESRTPGVGWQLAEYRVGPLGAVTRFCVEPLDRLQVAVTLPDDRLARFAVKASPECRDLNPALDVELVFTPMGDTDSSLSLVDPVPLRYQNGTLLDLGSGEAGDPDRYRLTTREGYVYWLDQDLGITEIEDPNGNRLRFDAEGIHHSDGRSVAFVRDGARRISQVRDPLERVYRYRYDAAGDLVAMEDPLGQVTRYEYDDAHRLLAIVDPDGTRRLQNRYDAAGRLVGQTGPEGDGLALQHDIPGRETRRRDALGRETVYHYDDEGRLLSSVDPLGGTVRYEYDEHGFLAAVTDPAGNTTRYQHNPAGDVLAVTDELGDTTRYEYDEQGRLLALEDVRGNRFEISRDARGNVVAIRDPHGHSASQTLDARGRLLARTDVLGHTHRFEYNATGDLIAEVDALGNRSEYTLDAMGNLLASTRYRTVDGERIAETTRFELDALDRVVAVVDPLGQRRRYEYDALGEDRAYVDPLGQRTSFETDGYGQLTRTIFPDGLAQSREYDLAGNLISLTDRAGGTYRYEYDALDRLVAETAPDGAVIRYEYDPVGNRVAVIDPLGQRHEAGFDAAGQLRWERDPTGVETRVDYDAAGNPVRITDAAGNSVVHHYDASDRLLRTVYPDGTELGLSYDAAGRLVTRHDPGGQETHYHYDALHRLTGITDALGNRTRHEYDEAGNRVAQIDANGHATRWTHDARGRPLSRTLPEGMQEFFEYDEGGNLLRHRTFTGEVIRYRRNRMDWVVAQEAGGETVSIEYDARGRRTRVVDSRGTTRYRHDVRDRLLAVIHPGGERVEYEYDLSGRRTALGFTPLEGETRWQRYAYDAAGRLASVTDWQGAVTRFGHDARGNRREIVYPNGIRTVFEYDGRNRPLRVETRRGETLLSALDYELAPTGHREVIRGHDGWRTEYRYDDLYRLVAAEATAPDGTPYVERYRYDAVGNRLEAEQDGVLTAYQYDANDRLLQAGGERYAYDAAGNLVRQESAGEVVAYRYDPWRRLRQMEKRRGGTLVGEAEYDYDLDGLRVASRVNGVTRRFLLDSARPHARLLAEVDDGGALQAAYVGADGTIARRSGDRTRYLHGDALGSTRLLSDAQGAVVTRYRYDAFGNPLAGDVTESPFLFAGEQWDADLGLYYLRARYYDAGSGRFTGIDPVDGVLNRPLSQHKYIYALNDPANTVDPSGEFGLAEFNISNDIRAELAQEQLEIGLGILDMVWDDDITSVGAAQSGAMVLMAMAAQNAMQLRNLFSRRGRTSCGLKKNSFPAGTLVSTVDGPVAIEDIAIGDRVLAYDVDEERATYREVLHLIRNDAEYEFVVLTLEDGEVLEATDGHPLFAVDRGWIDASEVAAGDVLRAADGAEVRVAETGVSRRRAAVYNLSVDQDPTFFVGERGVLVHNAKCKSKKKKRNFDVVVIGRNMEGRVKPYARFFGAFWYQPRPPVPPPPPTPKLPTIEQNRRWIRGVMKKMKTIYDIGPGGDVGYSEFYAMEIDEIYNYRRRQRTRKVNGIKNTKVFSSGYLYPRYRPVHFTGLFCGNSWTIQSKTGKYDNSHLCR